MVGLSYANHPLSRQCRGEAKKHTAVAQRDGGWAAQSVKNLVVRYRSLTGRRLLTPLKAFPRQRTPKFGAGTRVETQ